MANEGEGLRKAVKELLALEGIKLEPHEKNNHEDPMDLLTGKTEKVIDDLNEKAEKIAKKLGMSDEEIEDYVSNPNNFSNAQWAALEKVKQEVDKIKNKTSNAIGDEYLKQAVEKERKKASKKLGKKKKGWMQI